MAELSVCLQFLLILLIVIEPFVETLSFQKPRFDLQDTSIIYKGGAYPFVGGINLNSDTFQCQAGHATYNQKVRIWDSKTNKLTSFSTRFSSMVDIQRRVEYGSGFSFFLAPTDFHIPSNAAGGFLGLYNITTMKSSPGQIVHIEFDSVPDPEWDPPFQHVGININSLSSAKFTSWNTSAHSGDAAIVSITYDSITMNLTVSWYYLLTGISQEITSLSHQIDLRKVLPEWVSIGFSGSTRDYLEQHSILSWDFSLSLVTDEPGNHSSFQATLLMIETITPGAFLILVVFVAFGVFWTRKWMRAKTEKKNLEYMKFDLERGSGPRRISYADLVTATRNFSSENKLGKEGSGLGAIYKGRFPCSNIAVAVKKFKCSPKQAKTDLIQEINMLSRLRHPNLVQVLGWCQEKDEFFLVYEFLPNGNLDSHLFKNIDPLMWDVRYRIAKELASALLYLHEELEQRVEHMNVKLSNILLDSGFNAKLGDFGLAKPMGWDEKFGNLPLEYGETFRENKRSDVHNFGLVAIEIATGKRAMDPSGLNSEKNVVEWVWELYRDDKLDLAADEKLGKTGYDTKEMKCLLTVGIWCSHPDEDIRPSINQVIHVLNFDAVSPNLPSEKRDSAET